MNINIYIKALNSSLEQIEDIIKEYGNMSVRHYMEIQKSTLISRYKILIDTINIDNIDTVYIDSADNEVKKLKDLV